VYIVSVLDRVRVDRDPQSNNNKPEKSKTRSTGGNGRRFQRTLTENRGRNDDNVPTK